jgi:hypothetical protein
VIPTTLYSALSTDNNASLLASDLIETLHVQFSYSLIGRSLEAALCIAHRASDLLCQATHGPHPQNMHRPIILDFAISANIGG